VGNITELPDHAWSLDSVHGGGSRVVHMPRAQNLSSGFWKDWAISWGVGPRESNFKQLPRYLGSLR
jgi:hypothetical protein